MRKYMKIFLILVCIVVLIFVILIMLDLENKKKKANDMAVKYLESAYTEQIAEGGNNYNQQNAEEGLNSISISYMETEESEDIKELTSQLEAFIKTSFQSNETPICSYEGMNRFALYKKTIEKDIIFVNILFYEKDTNLIYTWKEDEVVPIGILGDRKIEPPGLQTFENDYHYQIENIAADELLDRVMRKLEQNGCNCSNMIYDGTIKFLNRDYYIISSFDSFEDHILRNQGYYIDSINGNIYCVGENPDFLRTELYYIDKMQLESETE